MNRAGQVVLKLKTAYRNGTTHIVMSPMEFMQRLAALAPRPRLHFDTLSWGAGAEREIAGGSGAGCCANDNGGRR